MGRAIPGDGDRSLPVFSRADFFRDVFMTQRILNSKPWFPILMLVCGLWSASPVWADAPDSAIQIEPDCLRVEIQDAPLPEVAKVLSLESGIEIQLPASLIGEFITTRLKAKDCSTAVLLLLQDFSMMKFWSDDGNLVAVQLLRGKQPWVPEAAPEVNSVPMLSNSVKPEEPQVRMAVELDQNQLQTLISVGKGKISPGEVVNDPVYKPFLLQAGLMDFTSWEDKKKLKTLHKHALRAWMKQHRQARKSR